MKIVKLQAENVKRLKAVEITPDGNLVVIAGRNGQGKTSVLDAIWYALGGEKSLRGVSRPIHEGARKAEVVLDLGDMKVTRSWTSDDRTYLKVEAADGGKLKSPQQVLDALVGRFSFDPLAFIHLGEKDQVQVLLDILNLPVDLLALDRQRQDLYNRRLETGRVVGRLEGQLAGLTTPAADLPTEEVSGAEVMEAYRRAVDQEKKNDAVVESLTALDAEIEATEKKLADLKNEIIEYGIKLASQYAERDRIVEEIANLVDPELGRYQLQMESIESTNAAIRDGKKYREVAADLRQHRDQYRSLTSEIEAVDQQKADVLAAASMPVDGLGFGDEGLTFGGMPFSQASDSERLRVSLAIAVAANPTLRVVRIRDGSLLDSASLALVGELADQHDMQVWVERVDDDGTGVGIHIEDGAVAG